MKLRAILIAPASMVSAALPATAQRVLVADASEPAPAVISGYVKQGASVAPDGTRLEVNNR